MSSQTVIPIYRAPDDRKGDFFPARATLTPSGTSALADKCSGCHGSVRCVNPHSTVPDDPSIILTGCPIGRNVPAFNKLLNQGDFLGAV